MKVNWKEWIMQNRNFWTVWKMILLFYQEMVWGLRKRSGEKKKFSYFGYKLNRNGISLIAKTKRYYKRPNTSQCKWTKSFFWYHRFLDGLSEILEPLHKLLPKGQSWECDKSQKEAFEKPKQLLTTVLSPYMSRAVDRPIAFL